MKNLLTRGGIEIIAVFIGISGGLWSEKQSELNKIIKSEETALISIKEALVSDSTSVYWIIKSLEKDKIPKLNEMNKGFFNYFGKIGHWFDENL